MAIKDFKKGQTAFSVKMESRNGVRTSVVEQCTVSGVGRKYLKVRKASGLEQTFREPDVLKDYLVEKTEYSPDWILFPRREQADSYIEGEELKVWIAQFFGGCGGAWKLSVAQLRAIRKIVEEWDENYGQDLGV